MATSVRRPPSRPSPGRPASRRAGPPAAHVPVPVPVPVEATTAPEPVLDRAVPALAGDYTAWLVTSLAIRLSRGASSYYTRAWGIGSTEYRLIMALGRDGAGNAVHVAAAADVDKAAASRSLKTLQERGLVALLRGGRAVAVSLTAEGAAMHKSLISASRRRDKRLTRGMSPADVARLTADLRRLIDNIGYMNEGGAP